MARRARVQFAGAIYHVLDRGDRREAIFKDGGGQPAAPNDLGGYIIQKIYTSTVISVFISVPRISPQNV